MQLWAYGWAFVDPNRKLGYNIFGAPTHAALEYKRVPGAASVADVRLRLYPLASIQQRKLTQCLRSYFDVSTYCPRHRFRGVSCGACEHDALEGSVLDVNDRRALRSAWLLNHWCLPAHRRAVLAKHLRHRCHASIRMRTLTACACAICRAVCHWACCLSRCDALQPRERP
eukprot:COSAG02_NODE_16776_length_1056_cov_1.636364_2_plen_171_part_00